MDATVDLTSAPSFDDIPTKLEWDSDEEQGNRPLGVKKGIKSSSSKQKGRRLQQWCAGKYLEAFMDHLDTGDVVSRSMGSAGEDLMLSPKARLVLPYDFEAKNTEKISVWATIDQSTARIKKANTDMTTCAIIKRNHILPIVIIPWGDFLNLIRINSTKNKEPVVCDVGVSPLQILRAFGCAPHKDPLVNMHEAIKLSLYFALMNADEPIEESSEKSVIAWDRYRFRIICAKAMAFYSLWDDAWIDSNKSKKYIPTLLFNRKDSNESMYVALPFDAHLHLLKGRWDVLHKAT